MRPGRLSVLLLAVIMVATLLLPGPLAAAERRAQAARGPVLTAARDFLARDWQRTKEDMRAVGDFLKADWRRTREDVSSLKGKLSLLGASLTRSRSRGQDVLAGLSERFSAAVDEAVDAMGPAAFAAQAGQAAGRPILDGDLEGADEGLLRARLLRDADETFALVAESLAGASRAEIDESLEDAGRLVDEMARGRGPESMVSRLRVEVGAHEGRQRGAKGFMKATWKVLRSLFFASAVGALGVISLGFLASSIWAEALGLAVVGGAAVVACLVGVIKYLRDGLEVFHHTPAVGTPEPEVAR